jgi:hypothetical protein
VTELFAKAMWTTFFHSRAVRIAFCAQTSRIQSVMRKIRQGVVPVALAIIGCAPFTQAHSMPGPVFAGSPAEERARIVEVMRDGISLDEAVSRAEAQYRARVVRTEVQDEDGRKVYVLKLLSDNGRVFTVRIDAATGRMR